MEVVMLKTVVENLVFVAEFLGIVFATFVVAYLFEKIANKKSGYTGPIITTQKIAMVGLFGAISTILMMFEFPVPFAPTFYKLDFSELPVMIITFAFGPVAGILTEFIKILLKVMFRSTTTAFVGELANFCVGASLILPSSIIYIFSKTRKGALLGSIAGTLTMTVFGSLFNALYLLPKFAQMYGMDLSALVGMGSAINPAVNSIQTFALMIVAPLNLLKGCMISVLTIALYKKFSPILKQGNSFREERERAKNCSAAVFGGGFFLRFSCFFYIIFV